MQTTRQKLETKLKAKLEEIKQTELRLAELRAYYQAIEDMMKLIPQDEEHADGQRRIRTTSAVGLALGALQQAQRPLHITDLLIAIGKDPNKVNRQNLTGSLGEYVRAGNIFCRPAPNTFGLVEWGDAGNNYNTSNSPQLPPTFGQVEDPDLVQP